MLPDRVLWVLKAGALFKPFGDGRDYRNDESGAILIRTAIDIAPEWFTPIYKEDAICQ